MRSRKIPFSEYKTKLVEIFDPVRFNAEDWIKAASKAGTKYFIITAKHHDRLAMYPSDAYPYDIRLTRFKRDPMRELRDAATKYRIKFGFYYSHVFDWEHPDAPCWRGVCPEVKGRILAIRAFFYMLYKR